MKKSWDSTWEKVYQTQDWGARYPNEELVRFIARLYKSLAGDARGRIRVLEVGCGRGANIWYLAREGFVTYGIDGAETAIQRCRERLKEEGLSAEVIVGDMIKLPYPEEFFDVVVDIASLQHNVPEDIVQMLAECRRVLKARGFFFSLARSARDYLFGQGRNIAENTYTDIPIGGLKDVGITHFFTIPEIRELWGEHFIELNIESLERTTVNMSCPIAHYIITARK